MVYSLIIATEEIKRKKRIVNQYRSGGGFKPGTPAEILKLDKEIKEYYAEGLEEMSGGWM